MKSSGIGGQAVLEGVMMKNKDKYAVAVRKQDHEISVELHEYRGISDRFSLFRLPILRGVAAFLDSLYIGTKSLTYSSDLYEKEEEDNHSEKKKGEGFFTFLTIVVSIALSVGIFILLPLFLSSLISKQIDSVIVLGLIEGVIRVLLFIGYVVAISQMNDIKRFFQYHGAEHKTINCVEHGMTLTVENVRKASKEHKRCGTSFMLFVMLISIIVFMFIQVDAIWLRYVLRILLVPIVSGLSYEVIRMAGRSDNIIIRVISAPGMWMQKLTTKEPDDEMIEVAIASVEAVFDWKAYLSENFGKNVKQKVNKEKNSGKKKERAVVAKEVAAAKDESCVTVEPLIHEENEVRKTKDTIKNGYTHTEKVGLSSTEIENSLEPKQDDDEDEVLKALDHYLFKKRGDQ